MQSASSLAPKVVRKCESEHWFSCGGDGRRSVGRSVYGEGITKFSGMGRFTKLWGSAHASASHLFESAPPSPPRFAAIESPLRETSLAAKSDERRLYFEAIKGYCTFITYHFQAKYIYLIFYRSKMGLV